MARLRTIAALVAVTTALGIAACGSDEPQTNPNFATGEAGSPAGGAPTSSMGDAGESVGGVSPPEPPGKGGAAGSPPDPDGAAGAAPELPPYDCVLRPLTHLEIINACTDAARIEKRPDLPALPQ
jgi:hypothetical protein